MFCNACLHLLALHFFFFFILLCKYLAGIKISSSLHNAMSIRAIFHHQFPLKSRSTSEIINVTVLWNKVVFSSVIHLHFTNYWNASWTLLNWKENAGYTSKFQTWNAFNPKWRRRWEFGLKGTHKWNFTEILQIFFLS